jgi:hypothetical protein
MGAVSCEFALSLSERQQMALYIAIGEEKGGEWDYATMEWAERPPPMPVLAVPLEAMG